MPSTREIPAKIEKLCEPCKYHKRINAFYGHSHSWADYNCMHPKAFVPIEKKDDNDVEKENLRIKINEESQKYGRFIGRTELQPDWCPLQNEESN